MSIRIGINNYAGFIQFIERIRPELPPDVKLVVTNDLFQELERSVRRLEADGSVDVFVSAGANADYMEKYLKNIPLVRIQVTGFDILQAVKSACGFSNRIAVITRHELVQLNEVKDLLNVELRCLHYNDVEELNAMLHSLYAEGIRDVIGSSFVIDQARLFNLRGHFIYSLESVHAAILTAISLARSRKEIAENARMLDHIMEYAAEGIIITDSKGVITHFNKSAEQIIGRSRSRALGKNCADILPHTQLLTVMREKRPQYNRVQDMGNVKIVTNRCPIIVNKEVVGALATFFSISTIKQAGESILRSQGTHSLAKISFSELCAESPCMQNAVLCAKQYAKSLSNILLCGENGTGKKYFAQGIHNASSRRNEPFIAFDCASWCPESLDVELFGIEEGIMGNKKGGRPGCLERASGGTLFLENIHMLPLPVQAKLLHVLEDKEYFRINADRSIPVDLRLITATDCDLVGLVRAKQFREDLYYHLSVLPLSLPPLRDRKEDIPILIRKFVQQNRSDLSLKEMNVLCTLPEIEQHEWHGNVRQLRLAIERFCALYVPGADMGPLVRDILGAFNHDTVVDSANKEERNEIVETLKACDGNRVAAAEILGMSRTTLWRRMKELDISVG